MAKKRIGILTGGGDVPGLNSVIKSVVYRGAELGYEVIGIRRGWEGLTHVDLNDATSKTRYILPLNRENTRTIDRTGGDVLAQLADKSHQDPETAPPFYRDKSSEQRNQPRRA
jgi:6-phosphofructokinase 1